MKRLAILGFLLASTPAWAFLEDQAPGGVSTGTVLIMPMARTGQGNTIIPSAASTAINASLSRTANSVVFPTGTLTRLLTIKNQIGSNTAYICWNGGTCSATVGEPLASGEGATESLPSQNMTTQPPTVYAPSGATLTVKW